MVSRMWNATPVALAALLIVGPASARGPTRFVNAVVFGSDASELTVDERGVLDSNAQATRVTNLRGGFVVPRLVDAHAHMLSLGRSLSRVDLRGTTSWTQVVERVEAGAPPRGWVFGRGWDQNDWADGAAFPTHHALSEAFPDRPVVLTRVDGHAIIANQVALARAGVGPDTPVPEGGRILRAADGAPTGVLIDAAMALVRRHVPVLTVAERKAALKQAFQKVLSCGLTGIHDMGLDADTIQAFEELDAAGELPLRVYGYSDGLLPGSSPRRGRRFSLIGVKLFADGALGSRGAALLEPYSDEPAHRGMMQQSPEELRGLARAAQEAGFQVAIHAIGDGAVRAALDALKGAPAGGLRGRIEHAQIVHADDFPRFAQQDVIASMQPTHATSDMPWAEQRVGPERIRGAYAWRRVLQSGATLVFGSDFPVESYDVRKGIYAAITRQDEAGTPSGGWRAGERVGIEEALTAFSTTPGAIVGDPTPWGDFTVFHKDLRTLSPAEILTARVQMVVVGGEVVYP